MNFKAGGLLMEVLVVREEEGRKERRSRTVLVVGWDGAVALSFGGL